MLLFSLIKKPDGLALKQVETLKSFLEKKNKTKHREHVGSQISKWSSFPLVTLFSSLFFKSPGW